ncbi:MAG TPA: inorganic phosphate transporter [Kofleriaceae bacterium]|nr:inorganic phosphate transporter [Kofleriaceae bacterium]
MTTVVLLSVLFLAFFNGANDNFKGVATIYGSRLASYRTALAWGCVTTAAGAMLAPVLAPGLIGMFKAKGLVPDAVAAAPAFMSSACLAAALTVAIATRIGMPVSTTHALTGGLVGAGFIAAGSDLNLGILGKSFVLPLLIGPFAAAFLASVAALGMKWTRLDAEKTTRLEADVKTQLDKAKQQLEGDLREAVPANASGDAATSPPVKPSLALNVFHFLSGGAVSFARGVNDAPKLMALGFAAGALGGGKFVSVGVVTVAMTVGGILMSRRVAETMSTKISQIEPATGVIANTTAAVLVILGSIYKLPLSTTHVTTGGIVGVGATRRSVDWGVIGKIGLAWITTLPTGVACGAVLYLIISRL